MSCLIEVDQCRPNKSVVAIAARSAKLEASIAITITPNNESRPCRDTRRRRMTVRAFPRITTPRNGGEAYNSPGERMTFQSM